MEEVIRTKRSKVGVNASGLLGRGFIDISRRYDGVRLSILSCSFFV